MKNNEDLSIILEFINNVPQSVKDILPYYPIQILKNYTKLSNKEANGNVYKIHLEGDLITDGYEKSLLLLKKGSMLKKEKYSDSILLYKKLKGIMTIYGKVLEDKNFDINESHLIDKTIEDTVVFSFRRNVL